jgi:hypothetical protein
MHVESERNRSRINLGNDPVGSGQILTRNDFWEYLSSVLLGTREGISWFVLMLTRDYGPELTGLSRVCVRRLQARSEPGKVCKGLEVYGTVSGGEGVYSAP